MSPEISSGQWRIPDVSPAFVRVRVARSRCKGYVLVLSLPIGSVFVYVLTLFVSSVRHATQAANYYTVQSLSMAQFDESDYIDSCQEPWMR